MTPSAHGFDGIGGCTKNMNVRIVLAAAVLVLLTSGGCSDEESASPAPSSTSTPTAAADAWRAEYSSDELAAFDESSQFVDAFNEKWRPVMAAGKATPAAKRLLQEYRADWEAQWKTLQVFEQREIVIPRASKILWTKPASIQLGDGKQASIEIVRCTDARDNGATEAGKPLSAPETPTEVVTTVERNADGEWLIYGTTGDEKSCDA